MFIYSRDLPSGGHLGGSDSYELKPLSFIKLMELKSAPEITSFRNYIKMLNLLIEIDHKIKEAPLIDADYLIFLESMITINEKLSFTNSITCPHCGNSTKVTYTTKSITPNMIDTVVDDIMINGQVKPVTIPTIEQFLTFVDMLPPYSDEWGMDRIKLYSLLYRHGSGEPVGMTIKFVDDAIYDEITSLYYIEKTMLNGLSEVECSCSHCQGGISIDPLGSVGNLFRFVLQHNKLDPNKIHFRKIREIPEPGQSPSSDGV